MYSVTALDGAIFTAETTIELATKLADHELGSNWEAGHPPFVDHTITWDFIEALELYDLRPATPEERAANNQR